MKRLCFLLLMLVTQWAQADQVLVIDAQYSNVTANVQGRLEAAGHTVTVTTNTGSIPTGIGTYQQVWDLRYSAALTSAETTNYTQFITAGGFAYFVTENPGCCMSRNNSIAALVTGLGGGSTQIGPGWADNVNSNVNTTYMTNGITVNYMAVAAIVNSQGIPLISDANGNVSGMSWIGRAGALGEGVLGTIITVADTNWLAQAWGTDNQTALDDIIRGIVAGTVAGTVSASGNGAGATNGNSGNATPTIVSTAAGPDATTTTVSVGQSTTTISQAAPNMNFAGGVQTIRAGNITTTVSTPTTVRTCVTPSTVNTWSDGSTTVDLGTQTCSDATSVSDVSSVTTDPANVSMRYDQMSQLRNVDAITKRNLDHDPFSTTWMNIDKDTRISIRYMNANGKAEYNTDTSSKMYGAAIDRKVSGVLRVGLQASNVDTSITSQETNINQNKTHVGAFGRLKFDDKTYLVSDINMAWNDISYTRTSPVLTTLLGQSYVFGNSGSTKSTDFWMTNRIVRELQQGVNVYGGLRSSTTRTQAYNETGTSLTALNHNYNRSGENAALAGVDVQKKVKDFNLRGGVVADTAGFKQGRIGVDYINKGKGAVGISYLYGDMNGVRSDAIMVNGRIAL